MADNKKTTKKTTKRTVVHRDRVDIVKLCAFWGIFIAAILFVASGILGFFDLGNVGTTIISVFNLIGKLALLVAVAFPAYGYVRGKGMEDNLLGCPRSICCRLRVRRYLTYIKHKKAVYLSGKPFFLYKMPQFYYNGLQLNFFKAGKRCQNRSLP